MAPTKVMVEGPSSSPAQVSSARLSLRSSNTPSTWISESSWSFSAATSCSPFWSEPTTMVRRSSRPWRAQLRTIERRNTRSATSAARPMKKNVDSQTREISLPSLTRKEAPMNSRNTKAQDEIIRVICRS